MVVPLSLDWPPLKDGKDPALSGKFPLSAGSFSSLDMATLGRRDAGLVQEYTETDASWPGAIRGPFFQHHWTAYQSPCRATV